MKEFGRKTVFLLILLMLGSSCGTSRKASKTYRKPDIKVTPEKNPPSPNNNKSEQIDTISWQQEESENVIIDKSNLSLREKSTRKDHYNVAFLAPFRSRLITNTDDLKGSFKRFIEYYAGMKLAAQELERQGVNLNIKVLDTEYDDATGLSYLNDPYLKNCDLIVGPLKKTVLKEIIKFGKEREIPVVSPWISSNAMTSDNPYYLQVKPSLSRHYEAINNHILKSGLKNHTVLVLQKGDLDRWHDLGEIFLDKRSVVEQNSIFADTLFVHPDSLLPDKSVFKALLKRNSEFAFFIPYASSQDEKFIYDVLRKLNMDRQGKAVTVYGPGTWVDFKDETLGQFSTINVRLTVSSLVDSNLENYKRINKLYYEKYGTIISPDALEGFDLIYYLGSSLEQNGTYFYAFHDEQSIKLTQTGYQIRPVYELNRNKPRVAFYENHFIQIVEYKDFSFSLIP